MRSALFCSAAATTVAAAGARVVTKQFSLDDADPLTITSLFCERIDAVRQSVGSAAFASAT